MLRRMSSFSGQKLATVVKELENFAPVKLAESWDNVGLLIEPYREKLITKILLTNDLTEPVMCEALQKDVGMIISYHPPIFQPLKRITQAHWKERLVADCLAYNIALYSCTRRGTRPAVASTIGSRRRCTSTRSDLSNRNWMLPQALV